MNKRNYCIGLLIILFISLMIPVQLIARDAPITTAGSKNACPGTAVSIPVTVSNFSDITAISLRLDYNPTLLTFTGPANSNTLLSGILVHNSNISSTLSRILISWSDPTPLTLTNGSKIIDLVFTYLSGSTSLVWNNTSNGGQECEYADENGDAMNDVPTANFYLNSTVTPSIVEAAGPISGSSSVCLEVSGITYSVQPIQGATGYNWTVPAGASIISGNNTSAIIVNFSNAAISGDVTVAGTNSCMTGTPSEIAVTVNPLPAAVAGTDRAICLGQSTQIGTAPVTGNTYNWSSNPTGFSSTVANPSVNPLVTTTYTLNETITATGCTKTNSVAVTVNPLPAAVAGTDRAICLGQSTQIGAVPVTGHTYSWTSNPVGYSSTEANPTVNPLATTTYTLTETITVTGCTKTNSVIVTVNPLPAANAGSDRAICLGQSTQIGAASVTGHTYSWTSNPIGFSSTDPNPTVNPQVTTTYMLTETITATGCTKTNSVIITVNPLPAAVVGTDRAICLGQSTQIGAAPVTGNTYNWTSSPTGFSSTVANPSVNPLVTTTYTLTETITATGCTKTNSIIVTVNPLPAAVAGTDRAICLGQSTQIGAAPVTGNTYNWTSSPTGYSSTVANPSVNPLVTTTYTLTETITATGCAKTNSVVVTVNPLPAAVAGTDRAICLGQSTQIGATSATGHTYTWSSNPTGFSSTEANPSVNPLVTTTYTLNETITATGCTKTNSVLLTVNPLPAANAGSDRAICLGQSTQIGAATVTGNTYNWTSSPTGFSSTVANPSVNPLVTTTYTLNETITATGCTKTNSVAVTVNPLPAAVAGTDRAICLGQSTQIGATAVSGNTYSWTSSPTGFSSTDANPTVNPLVTTTYTLNETITATGCTKTNSVAVTVNPLPAAVAGTDRAICLGQSTHIGAASVTGHTYSWTSNPIGFSSTDANPTVNPLVTTTYTLTETITATGCTKTNSVIITVNPLPTAIISGTKGICVGEGAPLLIELTGIAPWNFILSDGINNYPVMGNYENPFDVNVFPEITTTFSVISVTDATDCSNSGTGDAVITVNPLLPVSVSVSPSANPVLAGTLVKFTATPAYEGSSPSYQWKVNNEIATVSSDSSFSYIPSNNDAVACVLTSSEICVSGNPAHSNTVTMIVNSTPENASVSGEITQSACYAATNTISVAGIVNGSPTIFIIHPGGSTTMIAGQKIRYLQGTFIHSGGYLRGYIAPTGPYCSPPHFIAIMSDKEGIQQTPETTNIKIYPNPTTGSFVLELPGEYNVQDTRVKIYGMRGDLVLSLEQLNDRRQRVDLSRQPAGIYLVQVTDGKLAYRTKIIKTY